jgi:hypothetical protein
VGEAQSLNDERDFRLLEPRSCGLPAGLIDRAFYARVRTQLISKPVFNGLRLKAAVVLALLISKHAEAR